MLERTIFMKFLRDYGCEIDFLSYFSKTTTTSGVIIPAVTRVIFAGLRTGGRMDFNEAAFIVTRRRTRVALGLFSFRDHDRGPTGTTELVGLGVLATFRAERHLAADVGE